MTINHANLTRYVHPGKYEGELAIAALLHELTGDGCDEEVGSIDENGAWYGLMRGPFGSLSQPVDITPEQIAEHELNETDLAYLASLAGVIVSEDSQGFVHVEYYKSEGALTTAWDAIVADLSDEDEDEDSEPTEPEDEDITTTDHETFYQSGREVLSRHRERYSNEPTDAWYARIRNSAGHYEWFHLGNFGDDHLAALRAYMEREQWWPNVWFISDHGNAHLMNINE